MTMSQVEIECRLAWILEATFWAIKEKARAAFALPEREEPRDEDRDPRDDWCGLLS